MKNCSAEKIDQALGDMRRVRVRLCVCDKAGTALKNRLLYDGTDEAIAQIVYEAVSVTIEEASKTRLLRVMYLNRDGVVKSYGVAR